MSELRRSLHNLLDGVNSRWLLILPSSVLFAIFVLPLAALVLRSLNSEFLTNALSPQAFHALSLSLVTSSISTIIAVVFGTPLAYLLAHNKNRHGAWLELVLDLPIVLPPSVAGLALLMAFGRRGLFGPALSAIGVSLPFTTAAVVMAQTFVAAPLYLRSARLGFAQVDTQLGESAHVEGASTWQMLTHVMIPLAGKSLASGAILTWTRALGEFGATIMFAGNLEGVTQTMPLAIYLGLERQLGVALALAVVLIFVSVALLSLIKRLERSEQL
jgi:molybdate transport system permease protein